MVDIVPRSVWGAKPAKPLTRVALSDRVGFTLHHSAGAAENGHQAVRDIQTLHMDYRRWSDIGYNFVITPDGTIYEGRGWDYQGAHAGTNAGNRGDIAAVIVGTYTNSLPTPAALAAAKALKAEADRRCAKTLALRGHRDHKATQCPGDALYAWLKAGMPLDGAVAAPEGPKPAPPAPSPTPAPKPVSGPSKPAAAPTTDLDKALATFPVIRKGDNGQAVKVLQGLLLAHGYDLGNYGPQRDGIDGSFGPAVDRAVKHYHQHRMGVSPRSSAFGLVGPKTIAHLL